MEDIGQSSISGAPAASSCFAPNVLSHGVPSTVSTCSATSTVTSIQKLPTELIFYIVDDVDSFDLHSLNLTCKAFHNAIQHQRWRHVRLVGLPRHMPEMIRGFIELAEDPESLVSLKKITYEASHRYLSHMTDKHPSIASIIVLPEQCTQQGRKDWLVAADFKYLRPNPEELSSRLAQVLNFLGNKENCPQLGHLTIDGSGLDRVQATEINRQELDPIDGISLRLIGICDRDPMYGIMDRCVSPVDLHVSHCPDSWDIDFGIIRRLHYVVADGSMDASFVKSGGNVLLMEWLSIDGHDNIFYNHRLLHTWMVRSCSQPGRLWFGDQLTHHKSAILSSLTASAVLAASDARTSFLVQFPAASTARPHLA